MAIDRFNEALSEYLISEARKRNLQASEKLTEQVRSSESGILDPIKILSTAEEISNRSNRVGVLLGQISEGLARMTDSIKSLGFELPPAEILDRIIAGPASEETSRFPVQRPVQRTEDKRPERYFQDNFFLISDDEFEKYKKFIEDTIAEGQSEVEIQLGSEKRSEYREGLIKAGIRMNRKIGVRFSGDARQRVKGKVRFFISEPSEQLTLYNIEALRDNLGRYSAFQGLPEELLQKPVDSLGLESLTQNTLTRSRVGNVESVITYTEDELGRLRNFGKAGFYDLMVALAYIGVVPKVE